ncbi:MAG: hypothetical protein JXR77_06430 [Lentisphaeria bacterium]|nr:hypothetical protein [Lentisphaeria bacterium]
MIERMKHVTVVCLAAQRAAAVDRLRELGTVHVAPVTEPVSPDLDRLERRIDDAHQALGILTACKPRTQGEAPPEAAEAVEETLRLAARLSALDEQDARLVRARGGLLPWGHFTRADLERVRAAGLQVVLGVVDAKVPLDLPEGVVVREISRRGRRRHVVLVAPEGVALDVPSATLPDAPDLADIEREIEEHGAEREELHATLCALATAVPGIRRRLEELEQEVAYHRALGGMGEAGPLAFLSGYLPEGDVPALRQAAGSEGWALRLEDPSADDADVPTKLSIPRWARPILFVFRGLGILPGYREIDISACFLIFFSVFCGMLIGDAGYGTIFLVATVAARRRYPAAPAAPFRLFALLSVATIVWGVLTGTYFAIALPDSHPLRAVPSVSYLADPLNVQRLCFLLGAVHLTIAHAWNAAVARPRHRALGQLAWIPMLWGNYLLARVMVLGAPKHPAMPWLYAAGFLGVLLFSAPQRNPLRMLGAGVGVLALNLVNSFVDIVSYVRLFAAGAASVKVAQSFNELAGGMDGLPPVVGGFLAALILILGHGFNMVLGAMAVVVHGVRLNVLEFAGHVGLQFTGVPYRPLAVEQGGTAESAPAT